MQILLPVPIPGTELRERLQKQNRLYPLEDIGWEYYDGSFPLFDPDEPLSSERLQQSGKRIMGRFYQFGYVFLVPVSIISFGSLVLFLYNIRLGWRWWYRSWRNYIVRFGGWVILRKWARAFRTDKFPEKLQNARKHIN